VADGGRTRLGKGLSALLGEVATPTEPQAAAGAGREIPIARCTPNPHQPRERFDADAEVALAASIRDRGVLQPILVTPDGGGGYVIVAGERRWRAARRAGLETIPAVVRDLEPRDRVELALIENLQREDLNAIEEAKGYRELAEDFGLTHGEIAARVGRDRSSVANTLRLLDLPAEVQGLIEEGRLSMGHGRALLGLDGDADRLRVARRAAARELSVRQVEELVRRTRGDGRRRGRPAAVGTRVRHYEGELQRALGTRVRIVERRGGGGVLEVAYHSSDEFERLYARLLARP
jgi:ParB family chromosome partitioning protein